MDETIDSVITQIKKESDFFYKAKLLDYLHTKKGITISQLSQKVGIKPSYICHILRLRRLSDTVVDGYYAKLISISHLFLLSRVKDQTALMGIYEKILQNNLNVLQTEELVRMHLYGLQTSGNYIPKNEIQEYVTHIVGKDARVSVRTVQTRIKGKIIVEVKGNATATTPLLRKYLNRLQLGKSEKL